LAGIPQHAVPPRGSIRAEAAANRCVERVTAALARASLDYPRHASTIRGLKVVHASLDLVCLADHDGRRMFTTARGTDNNLRHTTLPRDLGNDTLIALGFGPVRVRQVAAAYQSMCDALPEYSSFGTGHSLGATVIEFLAMWAESGPERRKFQRIDLFNPGSSPLRRLLPGRRRPVPLTSTKVCAYCVSGDFISRFHLSSGTKNVLQPRKSLSRHALGHFLPEGDEVAARAREVVGAAVARAIAAVCVAQFAVQACSFRAGSAVSRALENVAFAEMAAQADAEGRKVGLRRHSLRPGRPSLVGRPSLWRPRELPVLPQVEAGDAAEDASPASSAPSLAAGPGLLAARAGPSGSSLGEAARGVAGQQAADADELPVSAACAAGPAELRVSGRPSKPFWRPRATACAQQGEAAEAEESAVSAACTTNSAELGSTGRTSRPFWTPTSRQACARQEVDAAEAEADESSVSVASAECLAEGPSEVGSMGRPSKPFCWRRGPPAQAQHAEGGAANDSFGSADRPARRFFRLRREAPTPRPQVEAADSEESLASTAASTTATPSSAELGATGRTPKQPFWRRGRQPAQELDRLTPLAVAA